MKIKNAVVSALGLAMVVMFSPAARAQEAAQPAPPAAGAGAQEKLPEVEVIQKKPTPAPKPKPVVKQAPAPQPAPVEAAAPAAVEGETDLYAVHAPPSNIAISPLKGSEVPLDKIPRAVGSYSSADIERDHTVIFQDFLNQRVPGVIIDDLQGNAFQTGVQYRGFEASPVNGLPQGLAVYQNGVRINEAFGDTVNWDFLPDIAIADLAIMGSNPIFGLNAIGGALSLTMKDGFMFQGATVDSRAGSFGRVQGAVEVGARSGGVAVYGAFEGVEDDGFRDFSDAEIRRGYADLGFKGDGAEFHINYTAASNYVGVTAAVPPELLAFGRERTFTSPQTTFNDMQMFSANGSVDVTKTLTFSGVAYHRNFRQKHDDGNIAEFEECENDDGDEDGPTDGNLCTEDNEEIFDAATGNPIAFPTDIAGSIDRTSQDAESYGGTIQAADKSRIFDHGNTFVIGTSYDHGDVAYGASSQLGSFLPRFVVAPTGPYLTGPSTITPRSLTTLNDYYGAYIVDTFDVTNSLAVTLGGRYNYARAQIINDGDASLDNLNGTNTYERFNPSIGATYTFMPALSIYGGYSEANRAPTASEIACSDPENPCIIESALASDPPLAQVVSKTWEAGLRGELVSLSGTQRIDWSAGLFKTNNFDDIIQIADSQQGRGYFSNFGETQRQGVEASISYRDEKLFAYATYAYVDATFETAGIIPSENNPVSSLCPVTGGDDDEDEAEDEEEENPTCVFVRPGDRLPGIPEHRFKFGFDYWLTSKWLFGADLITASDQIFYGDEGNDNTPLSGYYKINLHTSYDVTPHFQIYGLIENLTDEEYGIYGTYINVEAANGAAAADPSLPADPFAEDNAKTITPAIPFAAYGGVKLRF